MHAFDVIFNRRGAAHIPASLIGHAVPAWMNDVGVCFNGATSSSTWKACAACIGDAAFQVLQWGHVVVDVEGKPEHYEIARRRLASMGPRRRRRGRAEPRTGASSASPGFNGATSSSTWKVASCLDDCAAQGDALQWGHVVVDVEGLFDIAGGTTGLWTLQWGHVVVDVEG